MKHENIDSRRMDLHRRIALVLRKEPGLVRDFADLLRSKLATARSAAVVSDNEWEWYIILTLWSPLQVIRYWKIPANKPSGFARILPLSLCYMSLWLIASSNSLRCLQHVRRIFFRENPALKPPAARIHTDFRDGSPLIGGRSFLSYDDSRRRSWAFEIRLMNCKPRHPDFPRVS